MFAELSEKLSKDDKKASSEISSTGLNLVFSITHYISSQVCTLAREDIPGEEKKKRVIEATKDFILSFGITLPIPIFLLNYMIAPVVEWIYQQLLKSGAIV